MRISLLITFACFSFMLTNTSAQTLLWRMETPDSYSPSWIFGTMHARCSDDIHFSDSLLGALNSCEVLALELNLDDPGIPLQMARYAFLPPDSSLKVLLSEGGYDSLTSFLRDSVSTTVPGVEMMRPLFMIGLLIEKVLGCTPSSYEQRLLSVAKTKEKKIIGIETVEEQFSAFSTIPLPEQARMVLEMIRNLDETRMQYRRLDNAYSSADLDTLLALTRESNVEYGRYEDALLSKRNHQWVSRFLQAAENAPTLFAVGAGHLPGPDGILALLRAAGCTITPVIESH